MLAIKRLAGVAPEGDIKECTFASAKANKADSTLALKPREDITRNPKQGNQYAYTCMRRSKKTFKEKKVYRLLVDVNLLWGEIRIQD